MWINHRREPEEFTIKFENGMFLHIITDLTGHIRIIACEHGDIALYHAVIMADTIIDPNICTADQP